METFIPILIAIVVFAFQAYANFRKEQDKARKRNLGKPSIPPLPEENAERPLPKPEADSPGRMTPPAQRLPQPIQEAYESFSGFMEADKVTGTKKEVRNPTLSSLRVEVDEDVDTPPRRDGEAFDLRDAVIKSAILERPYA